MDNINSRCNDVTKEYKEKYDRLLSLVNGYEIASDNQNESMKSLADIINNTKELISESEFENLKKEQKMIMKDFARLEEMKDDPYSEESIEFSNKIKKETSKNIFEGEMSEKRKNQNRGKQRYMEEIIEEEEEEKDKQEKNKDKQRYMEEIIEEEEEEKDKQEKNKDKQRYMEEVIEEEEQKKKNNLAEKIKNAFSLQNINEINFNKSKNNKRVKEPEVKEEEKEVEEIPRYNRIVPYQVNAQPKAQQVMPNYYNDGNKKYDVFSNFVPNQNQQMPTIQIVNVQEAPKPKLPQIEKKSKLKEPNLKKNVSNFLNKSFKNPSIMVDNQNEISPISKLLSKNRKRRKKTKTKSPIDHFKNFLTDYTENLRFKKPNSKKTLEKKSKKCKNAPFIKQMNNLSNNHNLFK